MCEQKKSVLDPEKSDYLKYRGNCKILSQELVDSNPDLELVRGYYFCPIWSVNNQHWWCKSKTTGEIVDPSKKQFPSKGHGIYEEFNGYVECAECEIRLLEEHAIFESRYAFCSNKCHGKFIGVY